MGRRPLPNINLHLVKGKSRGDSDFFSFIWSFGRKGRFASGGRWRSSVSVLAHDIFADLKAGKITREKARDELNLKAGKVLENDIDFPDSYIQTGENEPLAYLLRSAASNIVTGVEE